MAQPLVLRSGDLEYRVTLGGNGSVTIGDGETINVQREANGEVRLPDGRLAWTAVAGDTRWVFVDGDVYEFEVHRGGRTRRGGHHESLSAPMPATVVRVQTAAGAQVKRGDTLIILEAMKMELPVRAPADGTVTAVHCREGELVQPGAALIELDD